VSDVAIDDLTFEDLRRIALEDLPRASSGEWTLHGAVDPGITILELLAWQFEQRLFMAEQVTEPLVRGGLRLLGVSEPHPAASATTVVSFRPRAAPVSLPAGTVLELSDDPQGRRFALPEQTWVLPVTAVRAGGRLATAGDVLELVVDVAPGATTGTGQLSLLVEVGGAPGVAAAWARRAVDVDPPARLAWTAIGPSGAEKPVDVEDTTGAFRRSGLLRVDWPAAWEQTGTESRRLRAMATEASWTEPVRILGVHPNAGVAGDRVEETADVSTELQAFVPFPGQRLRVPNADGQLCDDDLTLSVTEFTGERHDWTAVRSWVGVGPEDRVFVVDRSRGELRFGDGRSGRILRPAAPPAATLRYALGCGRAGNVGAWSSFVVSGGADVATNPVPAEDGAEPEPLASARQRAADALAGRDRTVTEDDARVLAVTTPGLGLARAHASPGFHPGFPCGAVPGALTVTIVPHADRHAQTAEWTLAPVPDHGALSTVRRRLEQARLIAQEVFVLPPVYRRVDVEVSVSATSSSEATRETIVNALRRYLDPLVGGAEREGWPFGGPVRPSALVEVVQEAVGPEVSVTHLAVSIDGGERTDCADLAIGPRELACFGSAKVTQATALPTGRGLR
jgi:hypothetical protein